METFNLKFQLSTWVDYTFPISLIDDAFEKKNTFDEITLFVSNNKDIRFAFDNYVGQKFLQSINKLLLNTIQIIEEV